ncbi:hypothetical protein IWX49DRAFT_566395, partial [Phyllosticta citricarpa]
MTIGLFVVFSARLTTTAAAIPRSVWRLTIHGAQVSHVEYSAHLEQLSSFFPDDLQLFEPFSQNFCDSCRLL